MTSVPISPDIDDIDGTDCTEGGERVIDAFDVFYVDDTALLIESAKPADLRHRVARVAALVVDVFTEHRLVVNMLPCKSETIMLAQARQQD